MLLVTGGAGFIGSNFVASLNDVGHSDIIISDALGSDGKWRNLQKHRFADLVPPSELLRWLDNRKLEAVIHLGAISDTTASDADLVLDTNFRLSSRLLEWCSSKGTPFIYASSAATYGDGSEGFNDDWSLSDLQRLRPMKLYGWSKHLFDQLVVDRHARKLPLPPQWVGLKFFNVFGPNEYHKGEMMSLIAKRFDDCRTGKPVRLFKSYRAEFADGDQRRDFIYVDDAVSVMRWLLGTPSACGIFNVGTGEARSFRDLMLAMFAALSRPPNIEYIEIPDSIRGQYQYFTQACTSNLRRAGYNSSFISLEEAVNRYVSRFLNSPDPYR